jgi:LysM repeat protein
MKRLVSCLLGFLLLTSSAALAQEATLTPVPTTYTVVRGDTLGNIAFRFGITTQELMSANNLINPDLIIAGAELIIPLPQDEASTVDAPEAPAEAVVEVSAPVISAVYVPPPIIPIPSIGFDVGGEVLSFSYLDAVQASGMTWTKFSLVWNIDASPENARRIINHMHELGFKVMLEISAAAPANPDTNLGLYYANFTAYLSDVAVFAPDAIEVWSGMNVASAEWSSGLTDANAYTGLLRLAFEAIKRGNANVLVISGALEPTDAAGAACSNQNCDILPYLQALAATDAWQYADCIGVGYTLGAKAPDVTRGDARGGQVVYYYPTLMAAYAGLFPNKPLCLTEIGYIAGDSLPLETPFDWSRQTTPELRAAWLTQAAAFARHIGRVRLFIVYNVDGDVGALDYPEGNYALLGADGTCAVCAALAAP